MDDVYPIVFIDAIRYSVREYGIIWKPAAYVVLGINAKEKKEVLTIEIAEKESSKYWPGVLNSLKNRGMKDILIICADGLSGIREAIAVAYSWMKCQRCIVHQVRNTLKYVSDKDKKLFAREQKRSIRQRMIRKDLRQGRESVPNVARNIQCDEELGEKQGCHYPYL